MAKYFVLNGSDYEEVSLDVIKKDNSLATEKDVQTVKGLAEDKVKKVESDLEAANKRADDLLARATSAESVVEETKKELEPLKEKAQKADSLESELNTLKGKHSETENKILAEKRKAITEKYKITGDKLKEVEAMDITQLESIEKSLELVGANVGNSNGNGNFDRNPGFGNQDQKQRTSFESIRDALKNNGLKTAHGSSDDKE